MKANCPYCHKELTLKEAIEILNGSGFVQYVRVKLPDGSITVMEAGLVNPNAVEILHEDYDIAILSNREWDQKTTKKTGSRNKKSQRVASVKASR